jgi:hypothetical protein
MEFLYFFPFLWVIFALLDSESGSGSTDLIESVSESLILIPFYELWSDFAFRRLTGKKLMAAKHLELQGWQVRRSM